MENDPLQKNRQAPVVNPNPPATSPITGQAPDSQFYTSPTISRTTNPKRQPRLKKILKILFVAQIILYVLGLWVIYGSRNANDLSGLGALLPLGLSLVLLYIGSPLFFYYLYKCHKDNSRYSTLLIILFVISFSTQIFHVTVAGSLVASDPPYGGYDHVICNDQKCMSQHFSKCELVDYTSKATVNTGTSDEAIATTSYSIFSTTEKFGCQISIKTQIETPFKDGSQRSLKNQTLYCQAYPGMDFDQYIQEVLDNPSQHKCT
jgi:hypothetical protein